MCHTTALFPSHLWIHSARRWDDALRDARDDLASDRRAKLVRGGDSAPPRLSVQGYRSLATLLTQRVRADREDEVLCRMYGA